MATAKPDEATKEQLAFDVAFALGHKARKAKLSELERGIAARAIVDHLVLANWRFERGAPSEAPSTPPGINEKGAR